MQYKKIQEKFNEVIRYSQGIENPQTDKLFADWLEAKRDFIEAMNGQLIWEWPEQVFFELGAKEKTLRIDDFISMVENRWQNPELANFISAERSGFFSNQVVQQYIYPQGEVVIPQGMKLLKAFKFFETNTKVLNDIQSAASMIIQEDKIEGTLCFSVHPLDFLSASENTHNWRSCHALDGEYRSGNLSYMVDHSTVMCYLKSRRLEKLPNFPESISWNSKKWRVFLYFSDHWDMLFAGRQYPFMSETGLDFVKERVLPVLHMGNWSPWLKKKIRSTEEAGIEFHFRSPYIAVGESLMTLKDVVINEPGSLQFNDLLSSSCYDPVYAIKMEETFYGKVPTMRPKPQLHIGGTVDCCRCGHDHIELSESFMCNYCEMEYGNADSDMFATCPCCGHRFIFDDGYWIEGAEEIVCPDCVDEYTDYCANCGEQYYKDDMRYDRKTESTYCKYCFEDLSIKEGV